MMRRNMAAPCGDDCGETCPIVRFMPRHRTLPKEVTLPPLQHQNPILIVHRRGKPDHSGGPAGREFVDLQGRIERVSGEHRFQETAGLFDKSGERVLDHEWEQTRPRSSLDQRLEPVRQQAGHPAGFAIFDVVMHGMVVPARPLKRREHPFRHRSTGQQEPLAEEKSSNQRCCGIIRWPAGSKPVMTACVHRSSPCLSQGPPRHQAGRGPLTAPG